MNKQPIHTTLSKECRDWIRKESGETKKYEGEIIEDAVDFYRKNKTVLEEYKQARVFIKEIVEQELIDDFTRAQPLLKRLIDEEIKDHVHK
jgi:hypothetical protein